MGSGVSYSTARATLRSATRAAAGISQFDYSARQAAAEPRSRAIHATLDPSTMRNGKRECRPSDTHPDPTPILIGFDVTGSMRMVPQLVQEQLGSIIDTMRSVGGVASPQVLMAAFEDGYDGTPAAGGYALQVGQFEPGVEMADDLSNVWLIGNGGGTGQENSDLLIHFAAYHTDISACRRRGILFVITDEMAYTRHSPELLQRTFGPETPLRDLDEALAAAKQRYDVFVLSPSGTQHANSIRLRQFWVQRVGNANFLDEVPAEKLGVLMTVLAGLRDGGLDRDAAERVLAANDMPQYAYALDGIVATQSAGGAS